jgi:hypothetical protein
MAVITCPACEQRLPDDLAACVVCGHPLEPAETTPHPGAAAAVAVDEAGELHAMALHKLALMCVATLGLYQLWWFYRNWTRVRQRTGRRLMPFWRSLFAPVWSYSLFDEVAEQARGAEVPIGWTPMVLAISFFLISAAWRFAEAGTLVSLFSFVPLLPVQATINALAERRGVRPDARIDGRHVAVFVAGIVLVAMVAVGTFVAPK